jgi:very-short-patch-repair endonuclease
MTEASHLELRFAKLWQAVAPDLDIVSQKKGVVAGRRFVYDFCIPQANVLIEVNGGVYSRGRSGHSSGAGIIRDATKVNEAQLAGFYIFVFTNEHLTKGYVSTIAEFCRLKLS